MSEKTRTESLAQQMMAVEVFADLLLTTNPEELGKKLTEQIRSMTGAQTVILLSHELDLHRLLYVSPERRRSLINEKDYNKFCTEHHPEKLPYLTEKIPSNNIIKSILLQAGVTSIVRVPLQVAHDTFGVILIFNVHDLARMDEYTIFLKLLSPVFALALRNAINLEKIDRQSRSLQEQAKELENRVFERTKELEETNRSLSLSRIATLNMMQDAIEAQKKAEKITEELSKSEAKYRLLSENAGDVIFTLDMDLKYTFVSPSVFNLRGYRPDEIIGNAIDETLTSESLLIAKTMINEEFQKLKSGGLAKDYSRIIEMQMKKKNGDSVWTEVRTSFILSDTDQPIGILGVTRDVSQRKIAEELLHTSNELNQAILNNSPIGISVRSNNGKLLSYNNAWMKIWAMTEKEIEKDKKRPRFNLAFDERDEYLDTHTVEVRRVYEKGGVYYISELKTSSKKTHAALWVSQHFYAILDNSGAVDRVVILTEDITERKLAEIELAQTKVLLNAAFEQTPVPMALASVEDNSFKMANTAASEFLGVNVSDYIGKKLDKIKIPWKDYSADGRRLETKELPMPLALHGISTKNMEIRVEREDGTIRWELISGSPIYDADGILIAGMIVFPDITDRKNIETALRVSEEKFRNYIESSPMAMFLTDETGNLKDVNTATCRLSGYTKDELLTKNFVDFLAATGKPMTETFQALKKYGVLSMEISPLSKKGTRVPMQLSAVKLSDTEYLAFCADISAIKSAEEKLKISEERHRVLYETMTQGVIYHNEEGEIEFVNSAAENILGLTISEMQGITSMDPRWKSIHEDGSSFPGEVHPAMLALKTGKPVTNVTMGVYHPKKDQYVWIIVSAVPYFDQTTKKMTGAYAVFTDITEKKKAEDAVALSERKYKLLFKEMLNGFALHEIICDIDGKPVDYRFIEVNPAFELLTGISSKAIIGKTVKEVMPNIEQYWIERYGRVALTGEPDMFMNYASELEKYYEVLAYSPEKGTFAVIMNDVTENTLAEIRLKESELRFRSLTENAPVGIYLTDKKGDCVYVNKAWCVMSGMTPEEAYGKGWIEGLHEEDQKTISGNWYHSVQSQGEWGFEYRFVDKRNTVRWVFGTAASIQDAKGDLTGYVGINVDITEMKKAQESLVLNEERLSRAQRSAGVGIWDWDIKSGKLEWSPELYELFGLNESTVVASFAIWNSVVHPDDLQKATDSITIAVKNGTPLASEYRICKTNGEISWISSLGKTKYDQHGNALSMAGICLDITERKITEEKLRESEEKFRKIYEDGPLGMVIVGKDLKFIITNTTFCTMFGYSEQELQHLTFKELTHPDYVENDVANVKKLMHGEMPVYKINKKYIRKDGKVMWGSATVSANFNSEGTFLYLFAMIEDITERMRAEEVVRISEARLARGEIVSNSGNWEIDLVKKIVFASAGARRIYGLDGEEWTLDVVQNIPLPEYREKMDKALNDLIVKQIPYDMEFEIHNVQTQELRDIHSIAEYDKEKKVIFGVIQDITDRKRIEDEINLYFNVSLDLLSIANFEGYFTRINPTWGQVLGWTNNELKEKPFLDFVHNDDKENTLRVVAELQQGKTVVGFDNRYRAKDGTYRWLSWNAYAMPDRDVIMAVARDITERKISEEILRSSEERIRSAIESANDSVYDWNLITKIGNTRILSLLGYQAKDYSVTYEAFMDLIHNDDLARIEAYDELYLHDPRKQYDIEFRMKTADGSYRWIRSRGKIVDFTDDGQPARMTGIHTDIHERKRHEEEIKALNAELEKRVTERTAELTAYTHELEAFSYSVSHDLRTPLRSINGFSRVLYDDYASLLDESGRDYLSRIMSATQRMGILIDDLLNLSRVTRYELKRELVDLTGIAYQIVNELKAADPDRTVTISIADGITGNGDQHMLNIVMQNLIGNAWKFTMKKTKGHIEIGVRNKEGKTIYHIKDNGAGFDMTYYKKLFGVFERLHSTGEFPGTGIGLAIVHRIILRHGGKIWAEAKPDEGATFYFTLE